MYNMAKLVKFIKRTYKSNELSVVNDGDHFYIANLCTIIKTPLTDRKVIGAITECFGVVPPKGCFGPILGDRVIAEWKNRIKTADQDAEFTRFSYHWPAEEKQNAVWILRSSDRLITVDYSYLDLLDDPLDYQYRVGKDEHSAIVVSNKEDTFMVVAPSIMTKAIPVQILITNKEEA